MLQNRIGREQATNYTANFFWISCGLCCRCGVSSDHIEYTLAATSVTWPVHEPAGAAGETGSTNSTVATETTNSVRLHRCQSPIMHHCQTEGGWHCIVPNKLPHGGVQHVHTLPVSQHPHCQPVLTWVTMPFATVGLIAGPSTFMWRLRKPCSNSTSALLNQPAQPTLLHVACRHAASHKLTAPHQKLPTY